MRTGALERELGVLKYPRNPQQCPAMDGRARHNRAMDGAFVPVASAPDSPKGIL